MSSTYAEQVMSLYNEYANANNIRPICLGHYGALVSMDQSLEFAKFMALIKITCKTLRKSTIETHIVCILVACCNSYDFNSVNVKISNNGTIQGFWRALCKSQSLFKLINPTSMFDPNKLIMFRSSSGFESCHPSRESNLIASSTTTSRDELNKREAAIKIQPKTIVNIDMKHPFMSSSGCAVFKDYGFMIASICGYSNGCLLRSFRANSCNCVNFMTCIDLETNKPVIICLQHGIKGATRIATMKTLVGTFLLNSSQCVYPDKHIDRSTLLPLIIKYQISQLL